MNRYSNKQEKRSSYNEESGKEGGYMRQKRQGNYSRNRQDNGERAKKYFHKSTQPETGREVRERKPRQEFRKEGEERERKREYFGRNYSKPGKRFKRHFVPFRKPEYNEQVDEQKKEELRDRHYSKKKQLQHRIKKAEKTDAELRLNRYISMSGVCSRRDADALIIEGRVKVNDVVIQTVGVKVKRNDKIEVDGEIIVPEKKIYIVLNKPKDYVTTMEDPLERKTVMSLIKDACKERVYPIGRLDRQTTGILLFTNDGDLSKKLTHPKYEHKKIYHVFLNRPLEPQDMENIAKGIELEDGPVKADEISYVSTDQMQVGIEIHSGRNRIGRRIFEHLGYQIEKLDRVYFAGITKKNLPRGRWRFLTQEEIRILKIY